VFIRLPDGESFNDSSARIVMTWASIMDPAIILSEVLLLCRPLYRSPRDISVERLLFVGNGLDGSVNSILFDDVVLLSDRLGVPALDRLCTTRILSLLSRLTDISFALLLPLPSTGENCWLIMPNSDRCAGSSRNGGSAVNVYLPLLRPRGPPSPLFLFPQVKLLDPIRSPSKNVCVTVPSVSSQSEPDELSSKKSGHSSWPISMVWLIAG
jgi:hypothetical protein